LNLYALVLVLVYDEIGELLSTRGVYRERYAENNAIGSMTVPQNKINEILTLIYPLSTNGKRIHTRI
jgi:hypothetical protein